MKNQITIGVEFSNGQQMLTSYELGNAVEAALQFCEAIKFQNKILENKKYLTKVSNIRPARTAKVIIRLGNETVWTGCKVELKTLAFNDLPYIESLFLGADKAASNYAALCEARELMQLEQELQTIKDQSIEQC